MRGNTGIHLSLWDFGKEDFFWIPLPVYNAKSICFLKNILQGIGDSSSGKAHIPGMHKAPSFNPSTGKIVLYVRVCILQSDRTRSLKVQADSTDRKFLSS